MKHMQWLVCVLSIVIAVPVFADEPPVGEIAVACELAPINYKLLLYNAADGVNRIIEQDFKGSQDRFSWSPDGDYIYYN